MPTTENDVTTGLQDYRISLEDMLNDNLNNGKPVGELPGMIGCVNAEISRVAAAAILVELGKYKLVEGEFKDMLKDIATFKAKLQTISTNVTLLTKTIGQLEKLAKYAGYLP